MPKKRSALTKEEQLSKARRLLGDARSIAFLRAAAHADKHPRAPGIACSQLEKGRSLDKVLERSGEVSVELVAERLSPRVFNITFGYHGPLFGDGGTWRVVFSAAGKVLALEPMGFWIH